MPVAIITAIETIPIRLPRQRERALGTAGSPTLLVGTAGNYRWSATVPALYSIHFETALVKVTLDGGMVGWGEAQAPLAPQVACTIVDLLLAPVLVGTEFAGDPAEIHTLWDRMYSTMRVRGQTGGFMLDAISGVDLALWDLAGKIAGKSVSELLCSEPKVRVPAYYSGLPASDLPARVEHAARLRDEGFGVFKLFHEGTGEGLFELLATLRNRLGSEAGLAVDALWRLDPETALAFGRELDRQGALWLEAPLPPEDAAAHAELAGSIRTPLALGESYRTRFELAPFFGLGALGYVQPDLGRSGITEGLRIAAMAEDAGVPVVPHVSIALGPQIAAAIHFAAALGNCHLLEYNAGVLEIANRFLDQALSVEHAAYLVPRTPGLGADINQDRLQRPAVR